MSAGSARKNLILCCSVLICFRYEIMLKYNYARYNNRLLSSAFRENVRHCYVFRIRDISVTYGIVGQGGNRWDVRYYNQIKRDI